MKVDIVGCHCTWQKELSTSFIVNDEFMIDIPQGSFKTIFSKYDISKIKYIFITHFHSDHFMDIHLLLEVIMKQYSKKIKIIAPSGCKERLFNMFKLVEVSYLENWVNDNVEFIDCENNKKIQFDGYKIKIFKMLHNNLDAYGFSIEKDKVKVGFTGDTSICNSVYKLIRASKTIFIDSSSPLKNNNHLCASEVLELAKEFTDTKFYPVHMSPSSKPLLEEKIELPYQGQVIIIK